MAKPETTTSYQWDAQSLIRRVDVRQQDNGMAVAYLYADSDPALHDKRLDVRAAIRLKGWGTLSDHRNNEFGLRVTGLRNGADLITMLQSEGFVNAPPSVASTRNDVAKPKTLKEAISANTLRGAGIFYSIGNAIYLTSGILRSKASGKTDTGQIGSALMWGAGDALVATIGTRDDARQLTSLLTKLKKHYVAEGIEIPATASIHVETSTKDKTLGSKVYDFLHDHVNQIKCGSEVLAAFGYYKAGKDQKNIWKQRTAITFGLGFLASLLIPERKIDEEKYAQAGPLGRAWMKIQSNPLSVGGISGYSNTVFTTIGAAKERKLQLALGDKGNKIYKWDFAAPGVMLFGNTLYAMSKKTVGGDIKSDAIVSDAYTVAAQIINKQPEELREKAIQSTAKFFAERTEIKENHAEVLERLIKEINIQRQNPWFEHRGLAPYQPQAKRGHVAHEMAPALASNDNDTAIQTPGPSTTLAAANDRALDGVTHASTAQALNAS